MVSDVMGFELLSGIDDSGMDAPEEEAGSAAIGEVETVVFEIDGVTTGGDDSGREAAGGDEGGDDKDGMKVTGGDKAGGDERGGETTGEATEGGEATGDDVKVELPGSVSAAVTGAVSVAGTVSKAVFTEAFPVGML